MKDKIVIIREAMYDMFPQMYNFCVLNYSQDKEKAEGTFLINLLTGKTKKVYAKINKDNLEIKEVKE